MFELETWSGVGAGSSTSVSNAGSKPAWGIADVDGWPRSIADRDLGSADVGRPFEVTDAARGRAAGREGNVTPKILFGSP